MTEPLRYIIDAATLDRLVEEARLEELAALNEAAALVREHSRQDELDAAYYRCERARARKKELLARYAQVAQQSSAGPSLQQAFCETRAEGRFTHSVESN